MEAPEVHGHAHHGHSGHRWLDLTASLCAIVVSVASLYLAIHHGHVMQEMAEANNRMVTAASLPWLNWSYSDSAESNSLQVSMNFTNEGVGPAHIQGIEVSHDGKPLRNGQELRQLFHEPEGISFSSLQGNLLRPGQKLPMVQLAFSPKRMQDFQAAQAALYGLKVRVCYCSVFNECWVKTHGFGERQKVDACPADWTNYAH